MIDDISLLLEFIPDVLVPIAAELLLENRFYVLYYGCIIDQLPIGGNGHFTGLTPPQAISPLVVEATTRNP
jgi:hypothetical protein